MVIKVMSITQNGLSGWLLQRITSLIIAIYSLFILGFLGMHPQLDYRAWHDLHASMGMKIISVLVLLSLLFHTWMGIWTVLTDYLKAGMLRLAFQLAIVFSLFLFFVWGIAILWSVGS